MQKWIPKIIAALVGLAGVMSLISALMPGAYDRMLILREFIPLSVRTTSRIITLLSGFGLIILAQNLWGRKRRAWLASFVLLLLSFVTHLTKGLDIEEALATLIPLILLVIYRHIFTVSSTRLRATQIIRRILVVISILTLYAVLGYTLLQTQFADSPHPSSIESDYLYSTTGIGRDSLRASTRWARWFENSLGIMSTTAGVLIIIYLFGPLIDHDVASEKDQDTVREMALSSTNSVAYFTTMPGNRYFWNHSHTQVIAYRIAAGIAVAIADPVGVGDSGQTIAQFLNFAKERGLSIILYNTSEVVATRLDSKLYRKVKIGEEAVIMTEEFSLTGSAIADVRHAVSKIERENLNYHWYDGAAIPWATLKELDTLHHDWLSYKNIPPLTFSVEYYPFDPSPQVKILVIKNAAGHLLGALSFLPYDNGTGMVLDMMIKSRHAPNGMMEAAIAKAAIAFRDQDVVKLNLSLAPLANSTMKIIYKYFNRLYQFKSLHKFKSKFLPRWESKYLIFPKSLLLPKALYSLALVHLNKSKL